MISEWFTIYLREIVSSIVVLALLSLLRVLLSAALTHYAKNNTTLEQRKNLILKYITIFISSIAVIGMIVIWGVDPRNIFTTLSAVITVIGVAFFAQWSVLSNVTAGAIILISFPFKIGDIIKVLDKDFPIEGEILDVQSFYTLVKTTEGEIITYPNNLLLQKGISIIKQHGKSIT